mmetsp:Transcript_34112/g.72659  ORF Transcript_34112/g.72659 Transcript_34112/m.72659 type:complete len:221 (+) Transcript_34112:422-1084(+)
MPSIIASDAQRKIHRNSSIHVDFQTELLEVGRYENQTIFEAEMPILIKGILLIHGVTGLLKLSISEGGKGTPTAALHHSFPTLQSHSTLIPVSTAHEPRKTSILKFLHDILMRWLILGPYLSGRRPKRIINILLRSCDDEQGRRTFMLWVPREALTDPAENRRALLLRQMVHYLLHQDLVVSRTPVEGCGRVMLLHGLQKIIGSSLKKEQIFGVCIFSRF